MDARAVVRPHLASQRVQDKLRWKFFDQEMLPAEREERESKISPTKENLWNKYIWKEKYWEQSLAENSQLRLKQIYGSVERSSEAIETQNDRQNIVLFIDLNGILCRMLHLEKDGFCTINEFPEVVLNRVCQQFPNCDVILIISTLGDELSTMERFINICEKVMRSSNKRFEIDGFVSFLYLDLEGVRLVGKMWDRDKEIWQDLERDSDFSDYLKNPSNKTTFVIVEDQEKGARVISRLLCKKTPFNATNIVSVIEEKEWQGNKLAQISSENLDSWVEQIRAALDKDGGIDKPSTQIPQETVLGVEDLKTGKLPGT